MANNFWDYVSQMSFIVINFHLIFSQKLWKVKFFFANIYSIRSNSWFRGTVTVHYVCLVWIFIFDSDQSQSYSVPAKQIDKKVRERGKGGSHNCFVSRQWDGEVETDFSDCKKALIVSTVLDWVFFISICLERNYSLT